MSGLFLSSDVLDGGLSAFALANKIAICSTEPASYTAATSAASLGYSTYAIGSVAASSQIGSAFDGRQITAINVSTGLVTAAGTPAVWAILDDANSRLLAYGPMLNATAVSSGSTFALGAISIDMPGAPYSFPLVSSTGGGASVDLNFAANRYYGSTLSSTAPRANFIFHADGIDGSTVFTDATGRHTITGNGNAQIDTAQSKFGGGSVLLDGASDWLTLDGAADFAIGTGDFTIDMWVRVNTSGFDYRLYASNYSDGTVRNVFHIFKDNSEKLNFYVGALGTVITGTTNMSTGVWHHVAATRSSGLTRIFLNGTQEGSTYVDPNDYQITNISYPTIGSYGGSQCLDGWVEEVRYIRGYAAWTANFTPPTSAYNDDPTIDAYTYLSCTRASIGYAKTLEGQLRYFGENQLRITNLGLLVEDARTNTRTYSQNGAGGNWGASEMTVTSAGTAPDGTATGTTCTPTTNVQEHSVEFFGGIASGARTHSIYVKRSSGTYHARLAMADGVSNFFVSYNLDSGATQDVQIGGSWSSATYGAEALADGYWRLWMSATTANTGGDSYLSVLNSSLVLSYAGDGTSGLVAWGTQLELGSFPSSYIPTTTTSATRAFDDVQAIGDASTVIANATASVCAQINHGYVASDFYPTILTVNRTSTLLGFTTICEGRAPQASPLVTSNQGDLRTKTKVGHSWNPSGRSLVLNGGTVATDSEAVTPTTVIGVGGTAGTQYGLFAYIERLTAWTIRVADAALQTLTMP